MTSRSRRPSVQARARREARLKSERESWRKAVKQCNDNIARFKAIHSMHGEKWRKSMIDYWQGRRDELMANKPKGMK